MQLGSCTSILVLGLQLTTYLLFYERYFARCSSGCKEVPVQVPQTLRDDSPWVDSRQVSKSGFEGSGALHFSGLSSPEGTPNSSLQRQPQRNKKKTLSSGKQWTRRVLYWHRTKTADAIWHLAQWHGELCSGRPGLSLFTRYTAEDLFPTEHKQQLLRPTALFGAAIRADCQRADWDSRQLSPSWEGGSGIKCCIQSCDKEPHSPQAPNVSLCN